MTEKRQLHEAISETEWHEAAQEMQAFGWDITEQAAHYSATLVSRVLSGICSVEELRAGTSWVGTLDAEAVQLGVATDRRDDDGVEALGRQIAHHAGRKALKIVGTRAGQEFERIRRASLLHRLKDPSNVGLGRLERRDLDF